jgi:hypothetical protein
MFVHFCERSYPDEDSFHHNRGRCRVVYPENQRERTEASHNRHTTPGQTKIEASGQSHPGRNLIVDAPAVRNRTKRACSIMTTTGSSLQVFENSGLMAAAAASPHDNSRIGEQARIQMQSRLDAIVKSRDRALVEEAPGELYPSCPAQEFWSG